MGLGKAKVGGSSLSQQPWEALGFFWVFCFCFCFCSGKLLQGVRFTKTGSLSREKRGVGKDKRGSFEALARPAWGMTAVGTKELVPRWVEVDGCPLGSLFQEDGTR